MIIILKRFPYKYLPYEERLLLEEASSLGTVVKNQENTVEVDVRFATCNSPASFVERLHRLTYFSHFSMGNGIRLPTQQFLFETTANGSRTAARQSTRYSTHGLHEYKGKFHPQIARYLMGRTNLDIDSLVFDPFAGSGTVLIEAIHFGCNALGLEANPLAVLVANSKIRLLTCPDRDLRHFNRITADAIRELQSTKTIEQDASNLRMTTEHLKYLRSWFSSPILGKLLKFRSNCHRRLSPQFAGVADVILSSIARGVSQQDPADLRIRRRKQPIVDAPVAELLKANLDVVMARALGARNLLGHRPSLAQVVFGDSRNPLERLRNGLKILGQEKVSTIITSPPYATALPYVDTCRLSLVILGLCSPSELKSLERLQIGNREISRAERTRIEEEAERALAELPRAVRQFVQKLMFSLRCAHSEAGFRKRNTPALLIQYFSDMKAVLSANYNLLTSNGRGFWLVGPNRTQLDRKWLQIDTPRWLADIAESVGFSAATSGLDAYQRFGLHQRNGIREECLLTLSRN